MRRVYHDISTIIDSSLLISLLARLTTLELNFPDLPLRFTSFLGFFACVLTAHATPVDDQKAEHASAGIDEVIVTASRRPVALDEISTAVSLVSRDTVLSEKLTTDALANQIGVYVQQTTPGQGAPIIRGLKGSAILHLVDGMPLSNAIFRSAPTPYLALVPATAVERIEVVRGTPASLYGSQAVGGVVQVVSRIPRFDSAETNVRRDLLVSFDTAELAKSIRGNVDVGNNRLAGSFSGEYLVTGNRMTGGGERVGPSAYSSKAARLALNATPTSTESWFLDLQLLEQPGTPRIDELVAGFGQTDPSSSEFSFAPNQRFFAHARHSRDDGLFGLDWHADLAWQRIVDDRVTRDYLDSTRVRESNRSDLFALSLNAAQTEGAVSWISGIDIQTDEVQSHRTEEDIQTMSAAVVSSRFPDGAGIDEFAVFFNGTWQVTQHQSYSGGLRTTHVHVDIPETSDNAAATINVTRLSGDVGWIYTLSDRWELTANAGFGFRAPNIFDIGSLGNRPGNRFNIPNTGLNAEHVRQFDFGVRGHGDRGRFELSVFTLDFDDRITSVSTGATTATGRDIVQSVNAAESKIYGFEAGIDYDLFRRMHVRAVLNYTRGQQRIATSATEAADRVPPLSGQLNIRFEQDMYWTYTARLTIAGRQDRLSDRDRRDVRIDPAGTPGWAILGVQAHWTPTDSWTVRMAADNLLDKSYRVHGSGLDSPGRNFSLSIETRW